jgi:hypothetical protein
MNPAPNSKVTFKIRTSQAGSKSQPGTRQSPLAVTVWHSKTGRKENDCRNCGRSGAGGCLSAMSSIPGRHSALVCEGAILGRSQNE